jgi:hypothetical protein
VGRYGQAILTIAGTIVGSYFGYPALGAALGSLAGSLLFPTQLPTVSGPRLQDITQTTSSVGTSIPRGWGTFSVAGAVIYQSDLREVIVTEEVGGKGGPTQEVDTPTYYQDFAIALCEGEDPIANLGPIAGVRRIWANGKPVYDRRPRQDDETESDFNQRIAASNVLDEQMVIYLGTEDQEPDPTMEADLGIGEVSAFRGLAYIMLINWQNKPEDGNKMPLNWKFEVYTSGALDPNTAFEYSNAYLPPWNAGADIPIYGSSDYYTFTVRSTGWTYGSGRARVSGRWSTLAFAQNAAEAVALRTADYFHGYSILPNSGSQRARGITNFTPNETDRTVGRYDASSINLMFNAIQTTKYGRNGDSLAGLMALGLAPGVNVHTNGYFLNNDVHDPSPCGVYQWWASDYSSARAQQRGVMVDMAITTGRSSNPGAVLITGDLVINVTRKLQPPGDQCAIDVPSLPGYCISTRGNLVRKQSWELVNLSFVNLAHMLARRETTQVQISGESINHQVTVVSQYPLNPALPSGHADYNNQAFWEAAYAKAVALGAMPEGLTYGVDYPINEDFVYRRQLEQNTVETSPVDLDDVVRDLMRESGYADEDFDVTALATQTVLGYVRTGVMAGRAAIEPLRQAKFFDGIESAGIIKFVKRGGPIVRSLTLDDLGFTIAGDDPPSKLTTQTIDETTLPRTVRVHYLSVSRDYEPGEQLSPTRAGTKSTNDLDVTLPMVLEDDEAARIAEVLWSDAWTSRKTHQAVIDCGIQELEPTDPIEVPLEDRTSRVRILSIEDSYPALRRMELIRDDDGAYVSNAVGTTPGYVRRPLQIASPAELVLLDIPALRDEDDDAGVYAATRPYMTDAEYRGATILRSTDNGGSYTSMGPVGSATPMGYITQSLPEGIYTTWDTTNRIRVQMQYGDLESRTEDAVLAGANAAAIGAHGRWEIVQFVDAEHLGDGVYELSTLLRGRRGTEHNIGLGVVDDRFVMLSMGGLVRLQMNVSDVGAERLYKVVAQGTSFADALPQAFTGNGEALRPFSPVHVEAFMEVDGDIVVEWMRRGRLGQTLQSGTDIALSEETEAYEVDIEIDEVVVRTIEVTAQTATYTTTQQAADFGTITGGEIAFAVYQISAAVGRGHVGRLTTSLDLIEDGQSDAGVVPDGLEEPDPGAIIVPLIYDEVDEAVSPLTWTRLGDGPRITPAGMVGDGYQARLRANAGLPAFVTSSVGSLYLRATIAMFAGARNATRDVAVAVCVDDATANPRLAFSVVDDPTAANEPIMAVRVFTGSMQQQRLCRKDWRFAFAYPEKSVGADDALPQSICHFDGYAYVGAHYDNNFCRVHKVDRSTGQMAGWFQMGVADTHMGGMHVRDSDGTFWINESFLYRVDVEASLLSHSMVTTLTYQVDGAANLGSTQWVTVDEVEYLLITEWVNAGTAYLYLVAATEVVDGGAFTPGDEIKRLVLPVQVQGVAYKDGLLYLGCSNSPSGGLIRVVDFDTWVATGTDGQSWSVYDAGVSYIPPTEQLEDLDFDEAGNLWTVTEGESTAGDDPAFLAAWMSSLSGPEENVYSAFYSGGLVTVRVNDRPFSTHSWTPTPTPGAITIGGLPQAAAGQTNGFFVGTIRDVVVQNTDFAPDDFELGIVYENEGFVEEYVLSIENPAAEDGTTGWTTEVGSLQGSGSPSGSDGGNYFWGGAVAHTKASQRLDLSEQLEDLDLTRLDAGDCWALVSWWAAVFSAQGDTQAMGFRFLNASLGTIAEHLSGAFGVSPTDFVWIPRSYGILIPTGTRYIEILMDMNRVDGSNNDGYIDEITAAVYVPTPNE